MSFGEHHLQGTPAAPGAVLGALHLLEPIQVVVEEREIEDTEVEAEITRFRDAAAAAREELSSLRERVAREIGESEAGIFDAHQMVLEDPLLLLEVTKCIRIERRNAEYSLRQVMQNLAESFASLQDDVLKERASDIIDVGNRVLRHFGAVVERHIAELPEPCIVVAHDLSPSETAGIDPEKVLGLAIEVGGPTSHTAILARSLGIPAIVGVEGLVDAARRALAEDRAHRPAVGIDGSTGRIVVRPGAETARQFHRAREEFESFTLSLRNLASLEAVTTDGLYVEIAANIGVPAEISGAREQNARGVGLYRTEYLFLDRATLPDEEEQYRHYRVLAEAFPDDPVTIRTIDIGGDKFLSAVRAPKEMNPFLGLRAIRLSLAEPDAFRAQIRAVLRASAHGKIRLLFPMVSVIEELEAALGHVAEVAADLRDAGIPIAGKVPVGIMIETPAAVLAGDLLAAQSDFFSIGTNDLVQYTLAVDRAHGALSHLYQPLQKSILRLLERTVEEAARAGIDVSVCGEMAADPMAIPLLLALGIRHLSMSPASIPVAKKFIRSISLNESREVLQEAWGSRTEADVRRVIENRFWDRLASLKPGH